MVSANANFLKTLMLPSKKLRTAHFLMFIGVLPLFFAVFLSLLGVISAHYQPGQAGASDAFLMIALLLLGFLSTAVLGGSGLVWSLYLTTRGIDQPSVWTRVLRRLVLGACIVLPLLYIGINIFFGVKVF